MTLLRHFFGRKPPRDEAALARIRGWAEAALGSDPPPTFTISEVECADPSCPGLETFILVMREGEATQAARIRKPIAQVSEADIVEAMRFL